jgi:hypothetical protein
MFLEMDMETVLSDTDTEKATMPQIPQFASLTGSMERCMQAVPRGSNNRVINEVSYEEEIEKSSGSHHYFRTTLMLASPHVVTFEAVREEAQSCGDRSMRDP